MTETAYGLAQYVEDLRRITDEERDGRAIVRRVAPLAQKLAASPGLVQHRHYACDPDQGFGVHLLHEEPDHTNAVFLISWQPDRGTPAHDHGTWAVVVGIEGRERETMWRRRDDGSRPGFADLERGTETVMTAGQVSALLPGDIHTVWNVGSDVSLSLHTYGKHINHTGRSQFDPDAKTEEAFMVTVD